MMASRRAVTRALAAIAIPVLVAGCSLLPSMPVPSWRSVLDTGTRVITGVDARHVVITEPLIVVIPERTARSGSVAVTVGPQPLMLGIEGAVIFLRAVSVDGTTVADRVVMEETDTWLPAGQYTLQAYYRTCDGNCGLLDPAAEFCHTDADVEASGSYVLTVEWSPRESTCTFGHT